MTKEITKRPVTDADLEALLQKLNVLHENTVYEFSKGKRFIKIWSKYYEQRSIYCFIEASTGDIYKAAGVNQPAKGVRGSLFDPNIQFLWSTAQFYR